MKVWYCQTRTIKKVPKGGIKEGTMETIKTNLLETKNVLGGSIQIYVGPIVKDTHAWNEKEITKDCKGCPYCINGQDTKDIIKIVNKRNSNNGFIPLSEEYVLGICAWGLWPKALVPSRMADMELLKKCRYFNGHG